MNNKICSNCGAEMQDEQLFCFECGTKYEPKEEVAFEKKVCKNCGTELADAQKFCHMCGAEYRTGPEVCKNCGAELQENARFCGNCGTPVATKMAASTSKGVKRKNGKNGEVFGVPILEFIKRTAILAVSLILLCFSFLPVIEMEIEIPDTEETCEVKIGAIDTVVFVFDSIQSLEYQDLQDSDLYDKINDLTKEYGEDWEDGDEMDELDRVMKYAIRLALQTNMVDVRIAGVVTMLVSIAYIAIAIVTFIKALLCFISIFTGKYSKENNGSIVFMALIPMLVLVVILGIKTSYVLNSGTLAMFGTVEVSVIATAAAVLSIVLAVVLLAGVAVLRIFFSGTKPKACTGEIVRRSLACAGALIMLLLAFAPVIATTVDTTFANKTDTAEATAYYDAAFFTNLDFSEYATEEYENATEAEHSKRLWVNYNALSLYSKREFESGEAGENVQVATDLVMAFGGYEFSKLFAFGTVAMIVAAIAAALVLWQNVLAVVLGSNPCGVITVLSKVLGIVCVVTVVVLVIVSCEIANYNAEMHDGFNYEMSIAWGVVMMLISSVFVAAIPMKKRNKCSDESDCCNDVAIVEN